MGTAWVPSRSANRQPVQVVLRGVPHQSRLLQEQHFRMPRHRLQGVAEVGLLSGPAVPVRGGPGIPLAAVAEQSGGGDQRAVGMRLLLDQARAASPELLRAEVFLDRIERLFDPPPRVVQVRQVGDAVAPGIQQGRALQVGGAGVGVLHQLHLKRTPPGVGVPAGQCPQGIARFRARSSRVGLATHRGGEARLLPTARDRASLSVLQNLLRPCQAADPVFPP